MDSKNLSQYKQYTQLPRLTTGGGLVPQKTELAVLEIAFAKGWNTVTTHPLPNWRYWRYSFRRGMSEQEAFENGILLANKWEQYDTLSYQ